MYRAAYYNLGAIHWYERLTDKQPRGQTLIPRILDPKLVQSKILLKDGLFLPTLIEDYASAMEYEVDLSCMYTPQTMNKKL